uniref:Uncharacterized protein n=1 Tax=Zea mays TaxID=4577 RepID=A0A804PM44_MAIZE
MQPRGAGRRGAARGYGRGSGRDHVWRRIEDGDVQNQRGGRNIEEANMKEGGDTLNQGWFRISGIPMEQRSLVTIAKVGGLVGKVIEIDERTRLRNEYVRARIACRDVTVVPGVVEGSLGLFLYDFFFEREIHSEEDEQFLETGIRIDDSNQKVAKRYKYEGKMQKDKKVDYGNLEDGNIKQHDECNRKSQSYTYQMQGLDKNVSKGKNVGAEEGKTGKSYSSCSGEEKNKVHITDSKEDDDSDLLGEELMAMKNRGSGSNSHTMWNIQADSLDNLNSRSVSQTKTSKCSAIIEELDTNEKGVDNSEELFSGTQGSSIVNVSQEEGEDLSDQRKKIDGVIFHEDNQKFMPSPIPVRRVSERLKKDMGIRIEEKNRRMAVKRNLEGLSKKELQDLLQDGAKLLLKAANTRNPGRELQGQADDDVQKMDLE